ncbi:MAG: pheromone processing endoprotease [Thelocarpon superellum]|nr:MAG: pheromone processing endoprotease [Thelocarpon superellum]
MRWSIVLAVWSGLRAHGAAQLLRRSYETHDYYAVHLDAASSPSHLADTLGLTHDGPLGELPDHHIFSAPRHDDDVVDNALRELRRRRGKRDVGQAAHVLDAVLFSQKQKLKPRLEKRGPFIAPRDPAPPPLGTGPPRAAPSGNDAGILEQYEIAQALEIHDPIFTEQWHLFNPLQRGEDVNVTGLWKQGITGHNATVAIVDDGLDMDSDDLKDNYFAEGSYDFNDQTLEPRPRLAEDRHGTRCAGEIAAVKNNVCGVGVAWDSKVAGVRILSKKISDADEAVAMNYAYQKNQIYSCSWGPPDDGQAMDAPGILIKKAMVNAVQNGRGGKGSIYVFASGNGAGNDDNCNFDGYTNSIYSITVGAVDRKGLHPYYSEKCCAQLVVTYSSGSGDAIHTTDVGENQCYSNHGGTSAAAPLAAGIFALVLSVRPDLSWRDLQYLTMQTAVPFNDDDGEWQTTTIGKRFSHKFGYGKLDAYAIVEAAKDFRSVKPQAWYKSPWMHIKQEIPVGDMGLASTLEVTQEDLTKANLARLEHITVTMNVEHGKRGDVSVELRSPNNVVSHLSATRRNDQSTYGYEDWTFMSVVHWGESGLGTWTVIVKDTVQDGFRGNFTDWRITLWGECIDESKATLLPMPTLSDDDDHETMPGSATTTIIGLVPTSTASLPSIPTDHIDRPVNEKPGAPQDEMVPTSATSATPSASAEPPSSSASDHFLPSFFPTFGVSKRTQIWIYGALTIIVLFCVGLGAYFYLARRKRLRNNPRDNYEFEMLADAEDREGMLGGVGGARAKRRAGELYDAFGGESDEELFSDEEKEDADADEDEEIYRDAEGGPSPPIEVADEKAPGLRR